MFKDGLPLVELLDSSPEFLVQCKTIDLHQETIRYRH